MKIEEIYNNDEISVRSLNLCRYNKLNSIEELLIYYRKHHSFLKLRNCGRKSDEELIEVCEKYQLIIVENIDKKENIEVSFEEIISNLNRLQREVINRFIEINVNGLSVRSKNALDRYLNGNFKINSLLEKKVFCKSFIFNNIHNIGASSIQEIKTCIATVNDFIHDVSKTDEEKDLIYLKNKFLLQANFSISHIPDNILSSESIFQLTDFLINNNLLFNENHTLIFKKGIKLYDNQKVLTTEEIAVEANLTRERVRQIRNDCFNELFEKLLFIKNFNDDLLQNYKIDTSANLIEINEALSTYVNIKNKTNFSKEFVSFILSVYLNENYLLIGNFEDVLHPKLFNNRNRHNWNNLFIIKKEFCRVDFISLTNDIDLRINVKINETYKFTLKSYLSRFISDSDFEIDLISLILPIAEKIINDEFGLYLDLDDNIIFKKNTAKQACEYSYEALENLGKPSKVFEIMEKITELYPNYETDESKVRGAMKRKDGFVSVGRKSVYGLKKWEVEIEDFKGGTIKEIVIEYLIQNDDPIHVYEILEEVHKYRDLTNAKNIITNLKLDPQKQFVVFNQSFIGLSSKTYESNLIKLPKFLGKHITNYIKLNNNVNIECLNQYFADLLKISNQNIGYILQQLIDNDTININEQKVLTI